MRLPTFGQIVCLPVRLHGDWHIQAASTLHTGRRTPIGGDVKQYQVVLSPSRLQAYNISAAEVAAALRETNKNATAGIMVDGGQEFLVQGLGRVQQLEQIGDTVVTVRKEVPIRVGQPSMITLLAIPMSLLTTMILLKSMGASINTMTLGGMAIAIGALVDDAIVDVENVFRRLRENHHLPPKHRRNPISIVFHASVEIRNSIFFATIIVILVFTPLFFLSGLEGRLLMPLATTYIVALVASLAVAVTVTPALILPADADGRFHRSRGRLAPNIMAVRPRAHRVRGQQQGVFVLRREDKTPVSVGSRNGVYKVFGVTPDWAQARNFPAQRGKFVDQDDLDNNARVCLIGRTVQRELFGDRDPIDQEVSVNQVPFKVTGVLVERGASLAEDEDRQVFVPLETYRNRIANRPWLTQLYLQLAPEADSARVVQRVQQLLRARHGRLRGQVEDVLVRDLADMAARLEPAVALRP